MNFLKQLWSDVIELFKAMARLPGSLVDIFKRRKQQSDAEAHETERLDRIRNPSKYLGRD